MVILEEFISPQQVEVLRDTTYELEAQYRSTGELPGAMAARQGLPFVAVVADDECWGIVSGHQQR